ncbi:MAG: sulfur carrier protein ThiS [Solirubrobacteraceae bacterium]
MQITVNGEQREVAERATVEQVLRALGGGSPALARGGRGVAVAVDGEVVPQSEWSAAELSAGATVEVLTAVQGG